MRKLPPLCVRAECSRSTAWNHACPPGFDPFFPEIQQCYNAIGYGLSKWPLPPPDETPGSRDEIEQSGS